MNIFKSLRGVCEEADAKSRCKSFEPNWCLLSKALRLSLFLDTAFEHSTFQTDIHEYVANKFTVIFLVVQGVKQSPN